MDFGWHTQWCWETKRHLKLSAKNMQSNTWQFKSQVFAQYTGHLILVQKS